MKPALVIIGLGNPGNNYERTRHNVGFLAVDYLSEQFGVGEWQHKQKFVADIQEARVGVVPVMLVKPTTYMNLSADAIRKIVDFYKLNTEEQIFIISDDIDIPLGEYRFRKKGGAGTHNGLKSIVEYCGEHFARLRVGIGPAPAKADLASWVLSALTTEEMTALKEVFTAFPEIVQQFIMEEIQ